MATGGSERYDFQFMEANLRLLDSVSCDFDTAAVHLDEKRQIIHRSRQVGAVVGTAGIAAALFTGGLSALAGAATVVGILYALSAIVEDILKNRELDGLETNWESVKQRYRGDFNIPRRNKDEIANWARRNLPPDQARAVIQAMEKYTSGSRSTQRLKQLNSSDIKELLESLVLLVAADFSVFEILIGAAKERSDPGDAVRKISREMRDYKEKLRIKIQQEKKKRTREARELQKQKEREDQQNADKDELEIKQKEALGNELVLPIIHNNLKMEINVPLKKVDNAQASAAGNPRPPPGHGSGHPNEPLRFLRKENQTRSENILASQHTPRATQTDRGSAKRIPPPSFCRAWELHGSFDSSGGFLQKPNSDVIVIVPPGAIPRGSEVDIYMSVCTDVQKIHQLLGLDDSVFVASPLVELWAGEGLPFSQPVQITLPHCLICDVTNDDVSVYHIASSENGQLVISKLETTHQSWWKTVTNILFFVRWVWNLSHGVGDATYDIVRDNSLVINTRGFSAYVCVECNKKNKGSPILTIVGFGTNEWSKNLQTQAAIVGVYIWDKRLCIRDFIHRNPNILSGTHQLTIDSRTMNDLGLFMSVSLDIVGHSASAWRLCETQKGDLPCTNKQVKHLTQVLGCEEEKCPTNRKEPLEVAWMLETIEPSRVGKWLRCYVNVQYVPDQCQTRIALQMKEPPTDCRPKTREERMGMTLNQLQEEAWFCSVHKTTINSICDQRCLSQDTIKMKLIEAIENAERAKRQEPQQLLLNVMNDSVSGSSSTITDL